MNHRKHLVSGVVLLGAVGISASVARASGITAVANASEPFAYPAGQDLNGQNGGTGFSTAWADTNAGTLPANGGDPTANTQAASLSFGNLATSGGSVLSSHIASTDDTSGNLNPLVYNRTLSGLVNASTTFVSYLIQPQDAVGTGTFGGYANLTFIDTAGNQLDFGIIGDSGGADTAGKVGQYGVELGNASATNRISSGQTAVLDQTAYLVLRMTQSSGVSTFDLFVDPTPGQPLPLTPDATVSTDANFAFGTSDALSLQAGNSDAFDEIRIGSTFADVSPVPEPASAGLLAAGSLLLVRRRRRATPCNG